MMVQKISRVTGLEPRGQTLPETGHTTAVRARLLWNKAEAKDITDGSPRRTGNGERIEWVSS